MPILTSDERLGSLVALRYRFDRVLANGGMSVVFEGKDVRTKRSVAIKLLKPHDCLDARKISRFLQERRLSVELRHPNIVDVLDYGEDDHGFPYLVMELLEGHSLGALLGRRGKLSAEETLRYTVPAMAALIQVHAAGVVHRDVKPDNLFLSLDAHGQVVPKLLDFGIAKVGQGLDATRTGVVMGTPEYMAPEQLAGAEATPATDVWAMAAVIYRCISGSAPFAGANAAEVIARATRDSPPFLDAEGLSPAFCATVDRALARDPTNRHASMEEFVSALLVSARDAGLVGPADRLVPIVERCTPPALSYDLADSRTVSMSQPRLPMKRFQWPRPRVGVAVLAGALLGAWVLHPRPIINGPVLDWHEPAMRRSASAVVETPTMIAPITIDGTPPDRFARSPDEAADEGRKAWTRAAKKLTKRSNPHPKGRAESAKPVRAPEATRVALPSRDSDPIVLPVATEW